MKDSNTSNKESDTKRQYTVNKQCNTTKDKNTIQHKEGSPVFQVLTCRKGISYDVISVVDFILLFLSFDCYNCSAF